MIKALIYYGLIDSKAEWQALSTQEQEELLEELFYLNEGEVEGIAIN